MAARRGGRTFYGIVFRRTCGVRHRLEGSRRHPARQLHRPARRPGLSRYYRTDQLGQWIDCRFDPSWIFVSHHAGKFRCKQDRRIGLDPSQRPVLCSITVSGRWRTLFGGGGHCRGRGASMGNLRSSNAARPGTAATDQGPGSAALRHVDTRRQWAILRGGLAEESSPRA